MTKNATVEITLGEYIPLWKKAIQYSMEEMEYTWKAEPIEKTWKDKLLLRSTKYTRTPFDDIYEYWRHIHHYWPWNEVSGMGRLSKSYHKPETKLTIGVGLFAHTVGGAERWDKKQEEKGND